MLSLLTMLSAPATAQAPPYPHQQPPIPIDQIGVVAGKDYSGDGLSVKVTAAGATLRCVFQRLDGEATSEGLWLKSTLSNQTADRFRVMAAAIDGQTLSDRGQVSVESGKVRFSRPGLVEEYSVSLDGVRQDFLILERPMGNVGLTVRLDVAGAKVEQTPTGTYLLLEHSGRRIAYHRLRVTDARGHELRAWLEADSDAEASRRGSECRDFPPRSDEEQPQSQGVGHRVPCRISSRLNVLVQDEEAVYPVQIDPTFSDANWVSMIPGIGGASDQVTAAVVDRSGNLYIAGQFSLVGDVVANGVAKWNGSNWTPLGSGMNYSVMALAVSGDELYAGGYFSTAGGIPANRIAKWNGNSWSALGSGMDLNVHALAMLGNELYAGGSFTTAGGIAADHIAKWDGNTWSSLGSGIGGTAFPVVYALAVSGDNLYAGGNFKKAGDINANSIARWDGGSWSALGPGMNSVVYALAISGSDLFAGGNFTTAGGIAANHIAKWDGNTWRSLGSGMGGPSSSDVYALAVAGSNLYAGGGFMTAGGSAANHIARWDGDSWSGLGSGMNSPVYALAAAGSDLYAGGFFTSVGGNAADRIARWNGSSWSPLGSETKGAGMNGGVTALAVLDGDLYVGGRFTRVNGIEANRIVKWNGGSWSALGSGLNDSVAALAVSGSALYVGGAFTTAGGNAANHIAKWDGSRWSPLGQGVDGGGGIPGVHALGVSGDDLYAGGDFTTAGGLAANYIAKWNGSIWTPLGSGMNGPVTALAVSESDLYVGGHFTTAGGISANSIAKWHGGSWSALGSGMNGYVSALVRSGNDLYAGGYFTTAGGSPANNIATWNGSSWNPLGPGVEPGEGILALAVSDGALYAGGDFTTAGGIPANYIARWDGDSWRALGSGMNSYVFALAVSGSDVYAGGDFTTAGGKVSAFVALGAVSGNVPRITVHPLGATVPAGGTSTFHITATSTAPLGYQWRKNGTNLSNGSHISGTTTAHLIISNVHSADAGDYTVVVQNAFGAVTSSAASLSITPIKQATRLARGNLTQRVPFGFDVDGAGNTYVAAWFDGINDFGGVTLPTFDNQSGNSAQDMFVCKRNSSDQLAWVQQAGNCCVSSSSGWDGGRGVAVDETGNVYVTGGFLTSGPFGGAFGRYNIVGSAFGINFLLAKYDSSGNVIWVRSAGGALNSYGTDLVVDAAGNCYVVGRYFESSNPGDFSLGTRQLPYVDGDEIFLTKFNNKGEFLWAQSINGPGLEEGYGIAQDGSGNVYVAGSFQSRISIGSTNLTSAGSTDGFIAKYTSDGTLIWTRAVGGIGPDLGLAVAADASGCTYVAGSYTGSINIGGSALATAGGVDAWFAKLSPEGEVIWAQRAGGTGLDQPMGADVDSEGNSYFTGEFSTTASFSGRSVTSAGSSDVFVTKFDAAGVNQWVERAGGTNDDSGVRIRIAPTGDCLVAGWFSGNVQMGGTLLSAQGRSDLFVARVENTSFIPLPSAPTISLEPQAMFRAVGDAVELNVTAIGSHPLVYQWRKNGVNLSNDANIAGATTPNLTISRATLGDAGGYSVVVTNSYGSVTSRVATLTISLPGEMLTLSDYFPLPLDADWLYDGTDWDGVPAKTRNHVSSVNANLTLFTGRSPAVEYVTNCIQLSAAYLDRTTLIAYDTWEEYLVIGGRFGQFGDDDLPKESLRVDGGGIFPTRMAVGESATNVADAYLFGSFVGVMTNVLDVLERTSLAVPAGDFPDVMHLRMTFRFPGGTQVQDQWWARSVGKIKRQGISGGGASHHFELISYSVPLPLSIVVNDVSTRFISNRFEFKILGQAGLSVVAETSSNLIHWLPLQTNKLGAEALHFIHPAPGNLPRRFYRARSRLPGFRTGMSQ